MSMLLVQLHIAELRELPQVNESRKRIAVITQGKGAEAGRGGRRQGGALLIFLSCV